MLWSVFCFGSRPLVRKSALSAILSNMVLMLMHYLTIRRYPMGF